MKIITSWQRRRGSAWLGLLGALAAALAAAPAPAQSLRFGNHRDLQVPDYATLRIGPFYSTATFSQSVGYRYTSSTGAGTDFLIANSRGEILEDGSDFPLVTTLNLRNYLLITRNIDLDASVRISYAHYPLNTQEDRFAVDLDEGVFGTLSSEFYLTPFLRLGLHDDFRYQTDYVDSRGQSDRYGGTEYEYINNVVGADLDWMVTPDSNLGLSLSRTDRVPLDDEFEEEESAAYRELLSYERRLGPLAMAGVSAGFTQTDFALRTRADTDMQQYSLFASAELSPRTKASVGVGYAQATETGADSTADEPEQTEESLTGLAALTTRLTPRLSYTLNWERSLVQGFSTNSAFEIRDIYGIEFAWDEQDNAVNLQVQHQQVAPSEDFVSDYSDTMLRLEYTRGLAADVELSLSSTYSMRDNQGGADGAGAPDLTDDYATWVNRIALAVALAEEWTWRTSLERVQRTSDNSDLEYARNIVEVTLTYEHEF